MYNNMSFDLLVVMIPSRVSALNSIFNLAFFWYAFFFVNIYLPFC